MKKNKKIIIVASVIAVVAIIAIILFFTIKNKVIKHMLIQIIKE